MAGLSPQTAAATIVASWISLCVAAAALAVQIEGVHFAPEVSVGTRTLALNGYALLRYKVLFKAYVAGLYLEPGTSDEEVLTEVPKRLEIEYFWDISASDFARATSEGIAANLPGEDVRRVATAIDRFNSFYEDVEPGDRYSLTYTPRTGTELALNGRPLGTIPGDDFARAIFSIWLGDRPLDAGLKAALLGG